MPDAPREPGWYPDRRDPEFNRYWNGRAWTARRHPANETPPEPKPRSAGEPHRSPEAAAPPVRRRTPVWMWVVGTLLVARTVFALVAAFDHQPADPTTVVKPHPSASSPAVPH